MNTTDRKRFKRALIEALDGLKSEARCYCFDNEPEYLAVKSYLENAIKTAQEGKGSDQ